MSDDFGLWEVFVSMFWLMVLFSWIELVISISGDIFRDRELSGGQKALWVAALILVPWVGALVYLVVRGSSMGTRSARAAKDSDESFRAYVRSASGASSSPADELRKLADLRTNGTISTADYEQAKVKVLSLRATSPYQTSRG